MGADGVPAVCVILAGAAALRALVDVPAAHPGRVGGVAGLTLAVEAPGGVDTVRIFRAVLGAVEVRVVDVALVQLVAGGLIHVGLAVVSIRAVLIVKAANIAVSTSVVVLVANPVAAVVSGGEAKRLCVVGVLGRGEVEGVEAGVVAAHRPAPVVAVAVIDAVPLPLLTRVFPGASPLTAVIILIPASSIVTRRCHAVVLTADHGALTSWVDILPNPT